MKKIVFLTSAFYPQADANGVCVKNVAGELIGRGFEVSVLCEGDGKDETIGGINIIHIKNAFGKRLCTYLDSKNSAFLRLFCKILLMMRRVVLGVISPFIFPNVSPFRTRAVYKRLEKLYAAENFDCVIGTFRPYENVEAVNRFKNKHPDVKSEIVYLDLIDGKNPFGSRFAGLFEKLCTKSEERTFEINDLVLIPKSAREKYESDRYEYAREKIRYFDFPLFTAKEGVKRKNKSTGTVNIVYAGLVDGKNRNAGYFLRLVDKINQEYKMNICVSFYGRFLDRRAREEFANNSYVKFCGTVSPDEAEKVLREADYLLNLSNRITYKMVPSKIFQLFSTCLPIINIVANKEDASLEYFEKYPAVMNICEYESNIETDAEKVRKFFNNNSMDNVEFQCVYRAFSENTPTAFADIII